MKLLYVAYSGGHVTEILEILWRDPEISRIFVTGSNRQYETTDAENYFQSHYLLPPIIPFNIPNLFVMLRKIFHVLFTEKPDVIISAGHAITIPFFYLGKIFFQTRLIYLESAAQVFTPSLTGRIVYPITDLFLVQWKYLRYKKAKFVGGLV